MRKLNLNAISVIYLAMASMCLYGQQFSSENALFTLQKEEKIVSTVTKWHLFEEQSIAEFKDGWQISEEGPHYQGTNYLNSIYSQNGNYIVRLQLNPRESQDPIDRQLTITVLNSKQQMLYTLQRNQYFDRTLPVVAVSDRDGALVLGESDSGILWFYDSRGTLRNQVSLFPDADYDLERILDIQMAEEETSLAVLASIQGPGQVGSDAKNSDSEPYLMLFDVSGREIWRRGLPAKSVSALYFSPDGQNILINSFAVDISGHVSKNALIFDETGQKILETEMLYKYASFSSDAGYLIMADNQQIRVFNLDQRKLIWQKNLERGKDMITAVKISDGGKTSVILTGSNTWDGSRFIFRGAKITIFDMLGKLSQELYFPEKSFQNPALWLSPQGNLLKVGFTDSYQLLSRE